MKELERIKTMYETFVKKVSGNENEELNANEKKDFEIIEKDLKVLEIMKNKKVDVLSLLCGCNFEDYNRAHEEKGKLTQNEYDLLKEVLL